MDGYFKPKLKEQINELRPLELDEVEHIGEDDEPENSLIDPVKKSYRRSEIFHKCPRCKTVSKLETHDPYCPECNWDSLVDLNMGNTKCAAQLDSLMQFKVFLTK